MKELLKKITDLTINEVLQQEVILPSIYLKVFSKYAKDLEIDLQDVKFNEEINKIIINELQNIDSYMKTIEQNVKTMERITQNNKKALLENKPEEFDYILQDINKLEKNVKSLNDKIYKDEQVKTYNRKWIYNKFLDENGTFKDTGICVLIDVVDFDYLSKEYGKLLANNYIIFTMDFVEKRFEKLNIKYKISRYIEDKFLIFIDNRTEKEVENIFFNLKKALLSTTLKSKSGILISGNLDYYQLAYNKNQNAQILFEDLFSKVGK